MRPFADDVVAPAMFADQAHTLLVGPAHASLHEQSLGLHGSFVTRHAWRIIRWARNMPVRARSCSRKRS